MCAHAAASPGELDRLEEAIGRIAGLARAFGLDTFPMRFEVCPWEVIYTFGAYGMPIRYSHWSFGKAFHRMKLQYDFNLSRIYELVINSDPCYAFLLDTNSLLQNKLVVAHVYAHCDFFKHNRYFAATNRGMVDSMAAAARRIREYEFRHGQKTVERFLDAAMAIEEHPDLLLFLLQHARDLEQWQQDVLTVLRDEALYFRPQMETKIMNEGWASFWHARILRELDLPPDDALEFARMHAAVLQPNPAGINPYLLGYKIFEHLEKRYGTEFLFEVREVEHDVSFIRNYLDEELVDVMDLYLFAKQGDRWEVTDKDWTQVRDGLVAQLTNCGRPYIYPVDADLGKRGELLLRHGYEGIELDQPHLRKVLEHLHHIWGRPVHLETVVEGKPATFSYNGQEHILAVDSGQKA